MSASVLAARLPGMGSGSRGRGLRPAPHKEVRRLLEQAATKAEAGAEAAAAEGPA